jgi:hypothetical protein
MNSDGIHLNCHHNSTFRSLWEAVLSGTEVLGWFQHDRPAYPALKAKLPARGCLVPEGRRWGTG